MYVAFHSLDSITDTNKHPFELRGSKRETVCLSPENIVGTRVRKSSGYDYPGTIVGIAATTEGRIRYVVEHRTSLGMLHIFSPEQLEYDYGE